MRRNLTNTIQVQCISLKKGLPVPSRRHDLVIRTASKRNAQFWKGTISFSLESNIVADVPAGICLKGDSGILLDLESFGKYLTKSSQLFRSGFPREYNNQTKCGYFVIVTVFMGLEVILTPLEHHKSGIRSVRIAVKDEDRPKDAPVLEFRVPV